MFDPFLWLLPLYKEYYKKQHNNNFFCVKQQLYFNLQVFKTKKLKTVKILIFWS